MTSELIRIGTRGSDLALAQVGEVVDALSGIPGGTGLRVETVVITTMGDRITDRPIRDVGTRGIFCSEIESALLEGRIDLAVHSMKDLPVRQPDGLVIDCVLPRADPRDALVASTAGHIDELPDDMVIGTSSLRRKRQVNHINPFVRTADIRGNIATRIEKCARGEVDCLLLAMAGLLRLGIDDVPIMPIDPDMMLPAPAQGAICVERRANDFGMAAITSRLNDPDTMDCVRAERAVLDAMGGGCDMPIAAFATVDGDNGMFLTAEYYDPSVNYHCTTSSDGSRSDPIALGHAVAGMIEIDWREGQDGPSA